MYQDHPSQSRNLFHGNRCPVLDVGAMGPWHNATLPLLVLCISLVFGVIPRNPAMPRTKLTFPVGVLRGYRM